MAWIMVDLAANFTILATKIGFQKYWKVLSLKVVHLAITCQSACQSDRSLPISIKVGLAISSLFIARVPTRC